MLNTRWTLLLLLAVMAPGCTCVDRVKTDHRLKGYAKHAWERYEACYEDAPYEDEMEEGFKDGYLQFVYRGSTTMPKCLPTKYNKPRYQNCFGKGGIQAYQQGFQLGIQAASQDCSSGPPAGNKSCLSHSGRNGTCATGNCATGQCASGQCATGRCATGQCATGQSATGQCATGNCPTGQCATGTQAPGSCATGTCGTGTCATCEAGLAPEGWQPQPGLPWSPDSPLPQPYEEVPGGLIPMPEAPAPSAVPEQQAPAPAAVPEANPEKTSMALPPAFGTHSTAVAVPQTYGDRVVGPGQVLPVDDGVAEVNGAETYAPAAVQALPVVTPQPLGVPQPTVSQPAAIAPPTVAAPRAAVAPEGWRPARTAPHEAGAFPEAGLVREPR